MKDQGLRSCAKKKCLDCLDQGLATPLGPRSIKKSPLGPHVGHRPWFKQCKSIGLSPLVTIFHKLDSNLTEKGSVVVGSIAEAYQEAYEME